MFGAISIILAVAFAAAPDANREKQNVNVKAATDRDQILEHIHTIFRAYLQQDRDTLRRTHTPDWTGFQGPSVKIERGIDAYMVNAEKSLQNLRGTGYELLDTEVQTYGDIALVYYVARYDYRDREGRQGSVPLRSVDIYRREKGGWNQAGSHITVIPQAGAWGEGDSAKPNEPAANTPSPPPSTAAAGSAVSRTLSPREQDELLSVREAVWRAWFAHDEAALRALVPHETIAMDPDVAAWADRDEILRRSARFSSEGGKLVRLEFPETRMQVYGDVAILYTRFLFETQRAGERTVTTGRGTEVFVRREGKWLNSGWHLEGDR